MNLKSFALILALPLSACGGVYNPEALTQLNAIQLCQEFARARNTPTYDRFYEQNIQIIRTTMEQKNLFTAAEWRDIDNEYIRTGMSEPVMVCVMNHPYFRVNSFNSIYGSSKQYIFGDFGPYVYLDNGRVTSWQFNQ